MCNGRANIVLAVPAEAGQTSQAYEHNLIELLSYFNIDPRQIRIGLILYGDKTVTILTPDQYKNRTQVNTRISLMSRKSLYYDQMGYTKDLAKALRQMKDIFRQSRSWPDEKERKIAIIFTKDQINSTVAEGTDIMSTLLFIK